MTLATVLVTAAVVAFPVAYLWAGRRTSGKRRARVHPWRVAVSGLLAKAGAR